MKDSNKNLKWMTLVVSLFLLLNISTRQPPQSTFNEFILKKHETAFDSNEELRQLNNRKEGMTGSRMSIIGTVDKTTHSSWFGLSFYYYENPFVNHKEKYIGFLGEFHLIE